MNELERVRSQAVGQEVDQELMERYPVQSQEVSDQVWNGNRLCVPAFFRTGEAAGAD